MLQHLTIMTGLALTLGEILSEHEYRFQCGFSEQVSFVQFTRIRQLRTYFCVNYPATALKRLKGYLEEDPRIMFREFLLDVLVQDECSKHWQRVIADCRKLVVYHVWRSPQIRS